MKAPDDLAILRSADRAARSSAAFRLVAGGLLVTLGFLALLFLVDPPRGARLAVSVIGAVVIFVPAWSMLGAAVVRRMAAGITDRDPATLPRYDAGRWLVALCGLPGTLLAPIAIPLLIALALVQVVRIPVVGWVLLVLLLPAILPPVLTAVRISFRAFLAGHLAAASVALDGGLAFNAYARTFSWLRARPWRVTLLRLGGIGQALLGSVVRLAAVAVLAALLRLGAPRATAAILADLRCGPGVTPGTETVVVLVAGGLLAVWIAAAFLCRIYADRAAQFLVLRRELDGVPVHGDTPLPDRRRTLAEQGAELVERLEASREEE